MKYRQLVQLFNSPNRPSSTSPKDNIRPNYQNKEFLLRRFGISTMTLNTSGNLINPFQRLHNAYCGLDPFRALRVMIFYRSAFCVSAHMESAFIIILFRHFLLFRPPVVIWEVPWSPGWKFREFVSRVVLPRADLCIVFARSQIELIKERFGSDIKCHFVPFCVDTDFFVPDGRPDKGYIFSTGRDIGRNFQIVIGLAEKFKSQIKIRTNIDLVVKYDNVDVIKEFLSYEEYRDLYRNAALVIVASNTVPNASGVTSLLEAMSMAKAVIVTAIPSLNDYLPPPGAGIVIQPDDIGALEVAVRYLISNPEAARQMGLKARKFVLSHFSPERHFEVYGEILSRL